MKRYPRKVLDELLSGVENADDLLGDQGLIGKKRRPPWKKGFGGRGGPLDGNGCLGAELTEHLGYEPDTQPTNLQRQPPQWQRRQNV